MIDKLSLSILDMDITNLKPSLEMFRSLGVTSLHIDIVDTSFADNISFGPSIVNTVLRYDFCFDIHIMVANPCRILDKLDVGRNTRITVHSHFDEAAQLLQNKGVRLGVALNPDQELDTIKDMLHKVSHVLVMTVSPGFGNQEMITECTRKIEQAQKLGVSVGVDGGISSTNVSLVRHADFIVVGSALTKAENKEKALKCILDGLGAPEDESYALQLSE